MNNEEIWKDIYGYENKYQVSNMGNIKSLSNNKIMRLCPHWQGYKIIQLFKNGIGKSLRIHRLVAIAFIENFDKLEMVNHINGIKDDNRVENLEWCNRSNNMIHSYKMNGTDNVRYKKQVVQLKNNNEKVSFESISRASKETGILPNGISKCCKGILKTSGGFKWEFA